MRTKEFLRKVMGLAWRICKVTGATLSEALKKAWMVAKLGLEMKKRIVQFFYIKASTGELRQCFGTLQGKVIDGKIQGSSSRKQNDDVMVYWDCEKEAFRCFKKFNLVKVVFC